MLSLKVLQSEMRRVLGRNQTVVALATNVARETAVSRVYVRRHAALIRPWLDSPVFLLHVPKCAGVSIARALGRPDPGHVLVGDHDCKAGWPSPVSVTRLPDSSPPSAIAVSCTRMSV